MRDDQPIIVIKKNKGHGGHHGGAWKVAFADFMTAMMAFFLVMWILGLSQPVRKSIQNYFNDPLGAARSHAGGTNIFSQGRNDLRSKPKINPSTDKILRQEADKQRFEAIKVAVQRDVEQNPELKELQKFIDIVETPDGLRIELMDGKEPTFFKTGRDELQPRAKRLLSIIGKTLHKVKNGLIIEGHTDARPYAGGLKGYSNYDLSSDRANAALKELAGSVRPKQIISVTGYADSHLRNLNDPNHFSNRRISILVGHVDAGPPPTKELALEEHTVTQPMHLTGSMKEEAGTASEKHPFLR
jgi:chemotaxis protein MotB